MAFHGVDHLVKVVDDGLIYDSDYETHRHHIMEMLRRVHEFGITLSLRKFTYATRLMFSTVDIGFGLVDGVLIRKR